MIYHTYPPHRGGKSHGKHHHVKEKRHHHYHHTIHHQNHRTSAYYRLCEGYIFFLKALIELELDIIYDIKAQAPFVTVSTQRI
ncbi:hypothetical protein PV325_003115 [Microctonus aethiopoides]|nr:hypothetical protein PV325_003115 [Microctonus aethiopoides]